MTMTNTFYNHVSGVGFILKTTILTSNQVKREEELITYLTFVTFQNPFFFFFFFNMRMSFSLFPNNNKIFISMLLIPPNFEKYLK